METSEGTNFGGVVHSSPRKASYKQTFSKDSPLWKEKLKETCLQRVRQQKTVILSKIRNGNSNAPNTMTQFIDSINIGNIINTELPISMENPGPNIAFQDSDFEQFSGEDYQDLMVYLEQQLLEDLKKEEQAIVHELDLAQAEEYQKFDEEYINAQLTAYEASRNIPCPICKTRAVNLNKGVFFCGCGFRLDTQVRKN
jgi:hypothetical protein